MKKFKVRVKYLYFFNNQSWYTVQYTNYRLIPIWKTFYHFHYLKDLSNFENEIFNNFKSAESFANRFKNINDVNDHLEKEKEKYTKFKNHCKEMWNKNKPKQKNTVIEPKLEHQPIRTVYAIIEITLVKLIQVPHHQHQLKNIHLKIF